jgi:hypothetical protein
MVIYLEGSGRQHNKTTTSLQDGKRLGGPTNREPGHRSCGKFEKKGILASFGRNATLKIQQLIQDNIDI